MEQVKSEFAMANIQELLSVRGLSICSLFSWDSFE